MGSTMGGHGQAEFHEPPVGTALSWTESSTAASASERLVEVVQELSLAPTLERIVEIVRHAARQLTGADGATFVLRDGGAGGDQCFYVDEDAIGPLWKGRRFPATACVSGWAMIHGQAVVIEDISVDPRIPLEVYSPTFVKSLVMVPIRTARPIGAIGTYWAAPQQPSYAHVRLLQALADSTSIAMENVHVRDQLERKVRERTADLDAAREELVRANEGLVALGRRKEELTALLVHDISSPAMGLMMRAQFSLKKAGIDESDRRSWRSVCAGAEAVSRLAMNILDVARSEDGAFVVHCCTVSLTDVAEELEHVMRPLAEAHGQELVITVPHGACEVHADREILVRVLRNLIDNAVRHNRPGGAVRLDAAPNHDGVVVSISDEGPGIPQDQRERVFEKYVRLEQGIGSCSGRGLGLTFCRLAARALGGRIWAEDNGARGSRFCLQLQQAP